MNNVGAGGIDTSLMNEAQPVNGMNAADLDAATFDLGAFIADTATYATYNVTVHLAAEEARRSVELAEQIDALTIELEAVNETNRRDSTTPSNASLGEVSPGQAKARELSERLRALHAERDPLVDKVKASALTFSFACTGREMQKAISERISQMFKDLTQEKGIDPDSAESTAAELGRDPQNLIEQTVLLMHEMTTKVTNASGASYPRDKLTEEVLRNLLDKLSLGEISRINQSLALAITGAQDYERAVDAGFPRRRPGP